MGLEGWGPSSTFWRASIICVCFQSSRIDREREWLSWSRRHRLLFCHPGTARVAEIKRRETLCGCLPLAVRPSIRPPHSHRRAWLQQRGDAKGVSVPESIWGGNNVRKIGMCVALIESMKLAGGAARSILQHWGTLPPPPPPPLTMGLRKWKRCVNKRFNRRKVHSRTRPSHQLWINLHFRAAGAAIFYSSPFGKSTGNQPLGPAIFSPTIWTYLSECSVVLWCSRGRYAQKLSLSAFLLLLRAVLVLVLFCFIACKR